jgi:hypothetical protein
VLKVRSSRVAALLVATVFVVACGKDGPTVPGSLLAGLNQVEAPGTSDSATAAGGPGFIHGTVVGGSFVTGTDSVANALPLASVVVTIYPRINLNSQTVEMGPAAGSVTTGQDGKFTLPTVPAGIYVITFATPANSLYRGVYTTGPVSSISSQTPWFIFLAKK